MTNTSVHFFDEPHVMQPGSVAEYLSGFAAHLTAQGYQSLSVSNYLWPALHFGGWIDSNRIPLAAVTNETLTVFQNHYCRCPGHRKRKHVSAPYIAKTRCFLEYLRTRRVIKSESVPLESFPACLLDFSEWLLQHRGSAATTVTQHRRMLRKILKVLGDDPITYDAANVRQAAIDPRVAAAARWQRKSLVRSACICGFCPPSVRFVHILTAHYRPFRSGNYPLYHATWNRSLSHG